MLQCSSQKGKIEYRKALRTIQHAAIAEAIKQVLNSFTEKNCYKSFFTMIQCVFSCLEEWKAKIHCWTYMKSFCYGTSYWNLYENIYKHASNHTIIIIIISFRHYSKQLRNSTTEKKQINSMNGWKRKNSSTANFQSATVLSAMCIWQRFTIVKL